MAGSYLEALPLKLKLQRVEHALPFWKHSHVLLGYRDRQLNKILHIVAARRGLTKVDILVGWVKWGGVWEDWGKRVCWRWEGVYLDVSDLCLMLSPLEPPST